MLNAKPEYAEREAEIVAEAGQSGAVTIATNMAGRGVDIKLGGNPEHLTQRELAQLGLQPGDPDYEARFDDVLPSVEERVAADKEKVLAAGGLYIVGTERHESRRIDNQLRGRAGRQGDPGESRFFLSAEDDLVRLFAGDRIYRILDRLGTTDEEGREEPIEAGMLSKQIEKAQKKVEEQNFLQRKRVLEYDDVMNEQRRIVYKFRNEILEGKDMGGQVRGEIANVIERTVGEFTPGDFIEDWDLDGLFTALDDIFPVALLDTEELYARADRPRAAHQQDHRGARSRSTTSARPSSATRSCARSSASCCCSSSTRAGASTSTTWTTCARASTCAASPRSSRSSRTRTRRSRSSPTS